ncbi:MAG TPA: hypothetical protein VHA06_24030 [Candidatus Angelobacter sp.]|nr:hypothetical protein [Candidatus Angelobacter sp.]
MKSQVPHDWSSAKLAFFAGLLSARMSIGDLNRLLNGNGNPPNTGEYWAGFLRAIKPFIPEDRWQGCLETVERIFKS